MTQKKTAPKRATPPKATRGRARETKAPPAFAPPATTAVYGREGPAAVYGREGPAAVYGRQGPAAVYGREGPAEGLDGAMRALALGLDKKALEPVLLDVRELCSFCNYQLVLSGRSDRQVDAIADGIAQGLKSEGLRPIGSEGARTGQWALLDYGDFVVHVFLHSAREHYDLEGLWSDAPRIPLDVPPDARLPPEDTYELEAVR